MIPDDRFSLTYVPGEVLNPLPLNRMSGTLWGPANIQDPTQGFFVQLWHFQSDKFKVTLWSDTQVPIDLFTRVLPISNVSVSFDTNANPCVAFQDSTGSYLYWFDPVPNDYVFFFISADATYPYVTLDDGRTFNQTNADNILGYIESGTIRYRQLRDRYLIEYTPPVGAGGVPVAADILYYIGMQSSLRLDFIYGDLPFIQDKPVIMNKSILRQKAEVEEIPLTFNFYQLMMFGEEITSATVTITLDTGTDDPDIEDMLVGSATHTDRAVTQIVKAGIPGNIYRIAMAAGTDQSCVYVVEGLLAINSSQAEAPA